MRNSINPDRREASAMCKSQYVVKVEYEMREFLMDDSYQQQKRVQRGKGKP